MTAAVWHSIRRSGLQQLRALQHARFLTTNTPVRLSNFWAQTGGIAKQDGEQADSHSMLVRGGYLRQAHSGVFHLLPLGLRVQNKLENLIDKHMTSIGASKLSLSSITTEELWKESGRYSANSEILRLKDRRDSGFLLSPTHEEEITSLVAGMVHSYKDLPLRLYQVGRKYRDERRPRGGLLRTKEFLMKDLYTFDYTEEQALATYQATRIAYNNLFDELKIPYLVADADSGNMGGKLSHEYHFVSPKGEDNVWSCSSCEYVANEELVEKRIPETNASSEQTAMVFTGISQDRTTKIEIYVPSTRTPTGKGTPGWDQVHEFVNLHAVKNTSVDLDTGIEPQTLLELLPKTTSTIAIYDIRLPQASSQPKSLDLTITRPGDACPKCEHGKLNVQTAIEVGHTFHLGTRYSTPLNALVAVPDKTEKMPMQMGCHGIGVSRLIGAIASMLADESGLNWPRAIAPFDVVVVATPDVPQEDVERVSKQLYHSDALDETSAGLDVVLDDRPIKSLGWKLRDADLIGYPVIVVLGRAWKANEEVEVQCRRLGFKAEMGLKGLGEQVLQLLKQL
ncbi:prolyl-tRNA synthetase-like protein [Lophiostoma macrostomum CBS 122681]|uniref:proline--tRNA ligase n=1 Tax=Lophiostoma macrostomum CBS 122681 TaxID=1314788 RepID=A0A6A6SMZ1_9PLEO|nr:prolyl-tRNA synthetase-like protein [Lophiostoma macrostomum CBS 122681]